MANNDFITKINSSDINKIWLSSDHHFHHSNIIKYCNRPFETVEEMNQALIDNWNSVVGKDDDVYHLGDLCFGNIEKWNSVLEPGVLNGNIHLILGNHDVPRVFKEGVYKERFCEITYQKMLLADGWTVFLNHFPFMDFSNNIDHKVAQAFGHIHSGPFSVGTTTEEKMKMLKWNQYDVGVDNNDYTPISLERFFNEIIKKREKTIV